MKFISFGAMDVTKAAEVTQASDKVWASPPPGVKMLADYACLGIAYPGAAPNTIVAISIFEADSNEALTLTAYPLALAGAAIWNVPVVEMPVGGAAEVEKKYRR